MATATCGVRPIVSLKSNVQLEKQPDGSYKIVESGNATWAKSHTETITIVDNESGLAEGATIEYGWSTSKDIEPSTWTGTTITGYTAGAKTANVEVTESGITGEHYLWIRPIPLLLKNTAGKIQGETKKSDNPYNFDNTAPTLVASSDEDSVTITMTDSGSGTASPYGRYYISTSSTELVGGNWKPYTSGTPIEITKNGAFYIYVEKIQDKVENESELFGTLVTIEEKEYHRFGPYTFEIDATGPSIIIGNGASGDTASTLTADAYGGYVTNYTPTNGVNDEGIKWRIFHTDGENIYLIADSYVPGDGYIPSWVAPWEGDYGVPIYSDMLGNYDGIEDVETSIANKWLKQYKDTDNTQTDAAKATAYLLDTEAWSGFKDSNYAQYAVGAPTIELFRDSYNVTHDTDIETGVTATGYQLRWKTADNSNSYGVRISGLDTSESLYVISDTFDDTVYGMWLASPSANDDSGVMLVDWAGGVSYDHHGYTYGSRPIICLKSDTQLIKKANGTYEIIDEYMGGNETWAKSHTETISILDEESGVNSNNTTIRYAWSKSNTARPGEWETATISSNSNNKLTYEITKSGLTGKYYLWVGTGTLTDNTGINTIYGDPTGWAGEMVSDPYYFDNTAPEIIITA